MATWYCAYGLDGENRLILDEDPFKTFDDTEAVEEALDRWAVKFNCEGETVAICKETYGRILDKSGRLVRIESGIETVEYYTVASGAALHPLKEAAERLATAI